MKENSEDTRFNDLLKQKFDQLEDMPSDRVWQAVRHVKPAVPPATVHQLRPYLLGLVAGLLLMLGMQQLWTLKNPAAPAAATGSQPARATERRVAAPRDQAAEATQVRDKTPSIAPIVASKPSLALTRTHNTPAEVSAAPVNSTPVHQEPVAVITTPVVATQVPLPTSLPVSNLSPAVLLAWETGLAQEQQLAALPPVPTDPTAIDQKLNLLRRQSDLLRTLQQRNDSLLQALLPATDSLPDLTAKVPPAADSIPPVVIPMPSKWSMVLLLEQTPGWGSEVLRSDSVQATERALVSKSTGLSMAHQLSPKLSMNAGIGFTQLTTELLSTQTRLRQQTLFETTYTNTISVHQTIDTFSIIRFDSLMRVEPILNESGQVIDYDTTYQMLHDTTYNVVQSMDTVRSTEQVISEHKQTLTERQQQQLRPVYRFVTVPLYAQYELGSRGRISAGIGLGTQLTFFRGGTRPVWKNGRYDLEKVGANDSQFRPFSMAISSRLQLQYKVNSRLSASVAPSVRWWAITPYKDKAATRSILPGLQLGMSWQL